LLSSSAPSCLVVRVRRRASFCIARKTASSPSACSTVPQGANLPVVPKFDTEKNKSVGLYNEIVAEKGRPRCDVFWNNEPLSTLRLQQQGLLEPYESPSAKPYPAWAKASDHTWHAFAGRLAFCSSAAAFPRRTGRAVCWT